MNDLQGKNTPTIQHLQAAIRQDAKRLEAMPQPQEWPQPQPITDHLLPVLSVTPDMIPESLRGWLMDIAHRMRCPLDYVVSACFVMLSSLIGTRLAIKPKRYDDWLVIPNLWGAVIGGPSTMKTPSTGDVFKPLKRIIANATDEFIQQQQGYEREKVDFEVQEKAYKAQKAELLKGKKVDALITFPTPPQEPTERRYMTNDCTPEKLGELLNENPAGILVERDELIGLLAGWERSGREQERTFYLEGWNGNGSQSIDRIGRGTLHVKNVCISLFGGIQPSKLLPYLKAATDYENDGFIQRLQLAVYPDPTSWQYTDEYVDKSARDRAYNLIKAIAEADFSAVGFAADEYEKHAYTRFSPEAQQAFRKWLINWETNVLPNEKGLLQEHFTKYRSLIPSLALIFHVCQHVDNPPTVSGNQKDFVSLEAIEMAIRYGQYLMSHARRIYGLLDNTPEAANELLYHLEEKHLQDGFNARDVYIKGWSGLSTSEQAEAAIKLLAQHYYIRPLPTPKPTAGRPPLTRYEINPTIFSNT